MKTPMPLNDKSDGCLEWRASSVYLSITGVIHPNDQLLKAVYKYTRYRHGGIYYLHLVRINRLFGITDV